jgi:1,2-diacylglycerol 3-alpha-glucosyltransferase
MAKALPDQLHICLIAYKFPILGRATDHGFLWPIAKGLANRGHQVTVIAGKSPLGKPEVLRDGVRVLYLHEGFPNMAHLKFEEAVYRKFLELNEKQKFDLVHSIDRSGYKIAKNKKKFDFAMTYDVEATQMSQLFFIMGMSHETVKSILTTGFALVYKFLSTYLGGDRELLKTADGVFVTSPQQRIFLERYYLYPDFHTYTVPYGIELGDLSPKERSFELRKKLNIPESANVVLTITDMSEPDEVINLLRGFERVAVKKPNSYMIIVGNGPHWKDIEYELYQLALGGRAFMIGAQTVDETADWIATSDVYVNLSSRTTGFEPSMIEAMAQKKVVIGSEMSPIANVVEDGIDGFLIRPVDKESLASLLIEIFSGLRPIQDIGHKAREKVINLFDTKKMVNSIEEAYRKVLIDL